MNGLLATAAENLVANLWGDLRHLPVVAGELEPNQMPSCDAGIVYQVMYDLSRNPEHVMNLGAIETEALRAGVDETFIARLKFRTRHEDLPEILGYAHTLREAAKVANVLRTAQWLLVESEKEGANVERLVPEAVKRLTQVERGTEGKLEPLSKFMGEARERLQNWRNGIVEGRSTGFKSLDSFVRLKASELTLIAARPSMGKTALAMQIAENVARQLMAEGDPGCVGIFSAEMAGVDLAVRMACVVANINADDAEKGRISAAEYDRLERTMLTLDSLPIRIDESTAPTTDQMFYRVAMMNHEQPVRMMLFDFVELGGDVGPTEELRISQIGRQLKAIAKQLKIPVLALSQLNRNCETRANKMPSLSDLRASGMLEQIADRVVFVVRPEYYISRGENIQVHNPEDVSGVAYLQFAKTRNGPIGMRRMSFVEQYAKFGDLDTRKEPFK